MSSADAVTAHTVYWGYHLEDLLRRISPLTQDGFGASEVNAIRKAALDLAPRSLAGLFGRTSRSFTYRVRFEGSETPLHVHLKAVDIAYVDVRFRTPDPLFLARIREQLWASYLASLHPIGHANLEAREVIQPQYGPRLILWLSTGFFSCGGYNIDHQLQQRRDTLRLELYGVSEPMGPCVDMPGPAVLSRELHLAPGRYTLLIEHQERSNRLLVEVTDSSFQFIPVHVTFLDVDARRYWRHPPNSFALYCSNVEVAQALCDDVEGWLERHPRIAAFTFPTGGVNPYYEQPEGPPDTQAAFFRYEDPSVLASVRPCLESVKQQIPEAVRVGILLRTWDGEEINLYSRRSYHEPHVAVPTQVTASEACRSSPA